jgi:quercetin dioxygenase-like cupin family protein
MKACTLLPMVSFVVLSSAAAFAQDPVKVDPTHYKVVFENATVRVLKIDYAVGTKSVMHQHPDAIVVPIDTSKVRFTMPDGKSEELDLPAGSARYTPAGTHNPENIGTGRVNAVLVEFKSAAPGTATLPATRGGLAMKVLAEGPRATAYATTADPTFEEPVGTTHEYDQVVIALNPAQMSLSVDGKPAKTTWARGDVQFIGRGIPHQAKNTGGKSVDFVIVGIK